VAQHSPESELRSNQQGSSDKKFKTTGAVPLNGLTSSSRNSGKEEQEVSVIG
jgi:hypothetical protein